MNTLIEPAPAMFDDLAKQLAPATLVRLHEPMSRRTTLRVGGPADFYVEPENEVELTKVLSYCHRQNVPLFLLGRGSNLLVRDGGIRGIVVSLNQPFFSTITVEGKQLRCGAGARMRNVAMEAKKQSLSGLEFLEGIPGTIGGGIRMNAGAMNSWVFACLDKVRFMRPDGSVEEAAAQSIPVEYRHCDFFVKNVALAAVFNLTPAPREQIEKAMAECSQKRWTSQPAAPSAGCIFKNPSTIPSGKLIQELGLKGTRVGNAVVSDVHGNFIVNDGAATAREVLDLIELIQAKARETRGIELRTEVQIVGEDG